MAEAARTEIENTRSLQYLVAIEEETKKKAHVKKGKYVGPMIRLRSAGWEVEREVGEENKGGGGDGGDGNNDATKKSTQTRAGKEKGNNKKEEEEEDNTATAAPRPPPTKVASAPSSAEEQLKIERTTLEVRNMQPPPYLLPQAAPPPKPRVACVITGKPAKYKDPVTGLAYADLAAYKEIQARRQQQLTSVV